MDQLRLLRQSTNGKKSSIHCAKRLIGTSRTGEVIGSWSNGISRGMRDFMPVGVGSPMRLLVMTTQAGIHVFFQSKQRHDDGGREFAQKAG